MGTILHGTLDLMILRALRAGPRHGYAVAEFIHSSSGDVLEVEEGALYPALHRLEVRGLLASAWGTSENNRRAKYYRLTRAGETASAAEADAWQRMAAATQSVLEVE
ncbi:MAG: PadR family transcriptional regulator [Terriglobales bacterium]